MAEKLKPTLDEAYERYVAGKIMRRDMFRVIIDAVKEMQTAQAAVLPREVVAGIGPRRGWPKGKSRKPPEVANGHALDAMPTKNAD